MVTAAVALLALASTFASCAHAPTEEAATEPTTTCQWETQSAAIYVCASAESLHRLRRQTPLHTLDRLGFALPEEGIISAALFQTPDRPHLYGIHEAPDFVAHTFEVQDYEAEFPAELEARLLAAGWQKQGDRWTLAEQGVLWIQQVETGPLVLEIHHTPRMDDGGHARVSRQAGDRGVVLPLHKGRVEGLILRHNLSRAQSASVMMQSEWALSSNPLVGDALVAEIHRSVWRWRRLTAATAGQPAAGRISLRDDGSAGWVLSASQPLAEPLQTPSHTAKREHCPWRILHHTGYPSDPMRLDLAPHYPAIRSAGVLGTIWAVTGGIGKHLPGTLLEQIPGLLETAPATASFCVRAPSQWAAVLDYPGKHLESPEISAEDGRGLFVGAESDGGGSRLFIGRGMNPDAVMAPKNAVAAEGLDTSPLWSLSYSDTPWATHLPGVLPDLKALLPSGDMQEFATPRGSLLVFGPAPVRLPNVPRMQQIAPVENPCVFNVLNRLNPGDVRSKATLVADFSCSREDAALMETSLKLIAAEMGETNGTPEAKRTSATLREHLCATQGRACARGERKKVQ